MSAKRKNKRADGHRTGVAAEYFVLSQLYRYGYDAYITTGNKKSIDIHVIHNGSALSIDVKAVRGYSSWPVSNVLKKDGHFVAYVAYKNKFKALTEMPDVYIVTSKKIQFKKTKAGKRSMKTNLEPYKDNWLLSENVKKR